MGTSSNARTPIHLVRNPLPVGSPSSRSRKRKIDVVDLTQDEPVDEVAEAAANAALAGNTTPKKRAKKLRLHLQSLGKRRRSGSRDIATTRHKRILSGLIELDRSGCS